TIEGKIKDKARYAEAMHKLTEAAFDEEGTLNHEWTIADDGETVHVYERYQDAAAAIKHLDTWAKYGSLYMEATEITRFVVFSDLTDELKEAVAGLNPVYMKPYGGFSKNS
ncbi:putative quinol monooxygenase, partial [Photobacterium sp. OFAV2-7]|uniref:putative quinol monooxygenase n=1 Tax=Photobacterium sp. OFAV2-7 TaxID=2917748 RepID=UPI001EF491E6